MNAKRVATYCRVSTALQTTDNQLPETEALATSKGVIVHRYVETGSAAKKRPIFDQMLRDAKAGAFDVLVVWSLDRFGRSLAGNVRDIQALSDAGVAIISAREPWLDTAGPVKGLLVSIMSWCAEQERGRFIERCNASISLRKAEGRKMGRTPMALDVNAAARMLSEGRTQAETALALGVSVPTLRKALRAA